MSVEKENVVMSKSYAFALKIIDLYKYLTTEKKEFVLSKQILRSGTAIGALVKESEHAQSKPDFINKINIALKEANETDYWLSLLKDSNYINDKIFVSVQPYCMELIRLLASIVKTSKNNFKSI